ncbi:hypothetical protein KY284_010905 [Solanum tuberosum]|nr:hypothetical protein KY284_010905 [Solanum tuberosum]
MNANSCEDSSCHGQNNDVSMRDEVISHITNEIGAIMLPVVHKDITFAITEPMLQLIKMRGLLRNFKYEDPNDHLHKFVNV